MKNYKVLSLFSGGGGLDIGFINAGFNIVASVEFENKFCETLKLNQGTYFNNEHKTICADISVLQPEELNLGEVDFIIGGPPCQSFSAAGRRAGGVFGINDTRGSLFWHYCRFIQHFQPKGFLFENVRGLIQANKSKDWEIIRSSFEELGYTLSFRILDAADYGVPQHRERLILVGIKDQTFLFPRPTHGPDSINQIPYVGVGEAIADLDDPNEVVPPYGGKYGDLLAEVPPGMNYLFFTEKMGHPNPKFAWRSRFSDFLYKADPNVPCKTVVASQGKYGGPFHWKGRKFTIPELKRIQTFPDEYIIYGPDNLAWKQIGNSVAPKFAEIIAKSIMNQLFDNNRFNELEFLEVGQELSFDSRKSKKARKTRNKVEKQEIITNQLNLFEESPIMEKNEKFELFWDYENPRKRTLGGKSKKSSFGEYQLQFELEKGNCLIDIEKKNVEKKVNINLDIEFDYVIANTLIKIKCNLISNSAWDIFVIWDAIHYAINKFTSYEDIQPLFGHFTEPYPKFKIKLNVNGEQDKSLVQFLKKICDFKYLKLEHSIKDIPEEFNLELIKKLRYIGFDIRVHQTNRTIPEGFFKICYPFTLSQQAVTFVPWLEKGEHKTADFILQFWGSEESNLGYSIDRKQEILKKLEEIYIEAINLDSKESMTLAEDTMIIIESFSNKINGAKTAFTNIVTCLIVNACDSSVDPRYHRPVKEGMLETPEGKQYFTGRAISENVIYPWLSSKGFRHAKSGWQTRTFERPRPYTLDYPENIGRIKNEFLSLLNLVAEGKETSKNILLYFIFLELKEKQKKGSTIATLAKTRVRNDTLIQDIITAFESHFISPRSSRLPVLAIYATYLTVFNDIKKYENQVLLPLGEHSAADLRTNAIGDIEIADKDGDVIEAIEVKHLIEINDVIALKAQEKISHSQVDRYYILTTHKNCAVVSEEVAEIIKQIHSEHHCELIVNGVVPTMKYYLRLASKPQDVIVNYSKLLESDSQVDTEHIKIWTEIIDSLATDRE